MVGIKHINSYLPETVLTNDVLEERFTFNPGFLERKIGIYERRIAGKEESTSDLCVKAAEKLFAQTSLQAQDVDLLVLCTQNPDYKLPHTTAILQDRLGITTHVAAFDINLGCSGYIYSLAAVQAWMQVHGSINSLLFTCDPYSKIIHFEDRATVPVFGDAATVTWVSMDSGNFLRKAVFGTDGAYHGALIVRNSGTRPDKDSGNLSSYLYMDGRLIYEYMMRKIPSVIRECIEKNQLQISKIDYFILHQASAHLINGLQRQLGISEKKMVKNLAYLGNTVSSTIPLALEQLMAERDLEGKHLLLCGFGVGLSWGATVLSFNKNHREENS